MRTSRYYRARGGSRRCRNGLAKRDLQDLAIRVVGSTSLPGMASQFTQGRFDADRNARAEVEILFLPGKGRFSGQADCNVLVALEPEAPPLAAGAVRT